MALKPLATWQWRPFLLLACGFMAAGLAVGYVIYAKARATTLDSARRELLSVARLIALQVDPVAHESLVQPEDGDTPAYREQTERLAHALRVTTGVRYVYTLRQARGQFFFVLDPTPPGDADQDGVDDKSYLMDPYDSPSPGLRRAFETGMAVADPEPSTDAWGTWLSAYVPIVDAQSRTVAVLGVDRDYRAVDAQLAGLRSSFWAGMAVVTLVALCAAWLLSRRLRDPASVGSTAIRARRASFRRPVVEALLLACVLAVLAGGVASYQQGDRVSKEQRCVTSEIQMLDELDTLLDHPDMGTAGWRDRLTTLAARLSDSSMPWLAGTVMQIRTDYAEAIPNRRDRAEEVDQQIPMLIHAAATSLDGLIAETEEAADSQSRLMLVAIGLAVAALVILRLTGRQEEQLARAVEENERVLRDFQRLVEGMPVGLFTWRDGCVRFTNRAWDTQTARSADESPDTAFWRSIHPDDQERLREELVDAEGMASPIVSEFRILGPEDRVAYFNLIGVPVRTLDGRFSHVEAFAVDVTRIVEAGAELDAKNRQLSRKNELLDSALAELEQNLEAMVLALVRAVEAKDPYTAGHSERVMQYAVWTGAELGLGPYEQRILELGTLVHDIGKIGVPDEVLLKPGRLTDAEFAQIRKHTEFGDRIIAGIAMFRDCRRIVRSHHERLDGSGYPDGLAGDDIDVLVRVCMVADAFDAMTSTRAYRQAMDAERALEELAKDVERGLQDPVVVAAFRRVVSRHGVIPQGEPQARRPAA